MPFVEIAPDKGPASLVVHALQNKRTRRIFLTFSSGVAKPMRMHEVGRCRVLVDQDSPQTVVRLIFDPAGKFIVRKSPRGESALVAVGLIQGLPRFEKTVVDWRDSSEGGITSIDVTMPSNNLAVASDKARPLISVDKATIKATVPKDQDADVIDAEIDEIDEEVEAAPAKPLTPEKAALLKDLEEASRSRPTPSISAVPASGRRPDRVAPLPADKKDRFRQFAGAYDKAAKR